MFCQCGKFTLYGFVFGKNHNGDTLVKTSAIESISQTRKQSLGKHRRQAISTKQRKKRKENFARFVPPTATAAFSSSTFHEAFLHWGKWVVRIAIVFSKTIYVESRNRRSKKRNAAICYGSLHLAAQEKCPLFSLFLWCSTSTVVAGWRRRRQLLASKWPASSCFVPAILEAAVGWPLGGDFLDKTARVGRKQVNWVEKRQIVHHQT